MADLRSATDANYHFGELKMCHDRSRRGSYAMVVVEGKSDEMLYAKLFLRGCIFFSVDGWENVEAVMGLVQRHAIPGAVGILDADFRRVEEQVVSITNLFLTDCHDAELMMLNSPAWEGIRDIYCDVTIKADGNPSKLVQFETAQKTSLLSAMLQAAMPLSCLRLLNHRHNLGLIFKAGSGNKLKYIDYEDFINPKTLAVSEGALLSTVENKSSKLRFFTNNPTRKQEFEALRSENGDPWEWCNGHDVLNIFSLALEQAVSNRRSGTKVDLKELETNLAVAYRLEDFKGTQLCLALQQWQVDNAPFRILP